MELKPYFIQFLNAFYIYLSIYVKYTNKFGFDFLKNTIVIW